MGSSKLRINQYKYSIKLYSEGRKGFKQEQLIEHFLEGYNDTYKDITVQITDHCEPNDKERKDDYWIHQLNTSYGSKWS